MKNDDATSITFSPLPHSKAYTKVLILFIIAVFLCTTAFVCQMLYGGKKQEILNAHKERMQANAINTAESIAYWATEQGVLAHRLGESDLFRIFASGSASTDSSKVPASPPPSQGEDKPAEMLPQLRHVLQTFMVYAGLQDARLVDSDGVTLLSPQALPPALQRGQRVVLSESLQNKTLTFGSVRGTSSGIVLDYAIPLMPMKGQGTLVEPMGALVFTIPVTSHIARFLSSGRGADGQFMSWILQRRSGQWEKLLSRNAQPVPIDATVAPSGKGALPFQRRTCPDGHKNVYSLAVPVPQLNWTLVLAMSAEKVDAQISEAFNDIFGMGALLSGGVILLFTLLWWTMRGREQRGEADRFEKLYHVMRGQKQLLDSINVSLDVGLILADASGVVHMANRSFARLTGKEENLLPGQSLGALLGGHVARQVQEAIGQAIARESTWTLEITVQIDNAPRLFRVTLFPHLDANSGISPRGAVIIFNDITEYRRQSEYRRRQQNRTIEALIAAIENVDPYLTGHSHMMRQLVLLMADHMHLESRDKDTLATAAALSQIGKIFVPRHLLTKTEKLARQEMEELSRGPEYAYAVLRNIDFGIPVPLAIWQMGERLDGSGTPHKLQGGSIGIHARILGVVNTFCAMVSPRSFRNGISPHEALYYLRTQQAAYDQAAVEALAHILTTPEGEQVLLLRKKEEGTVA